MFIETTSNTQSIPQKRFYIRAKTKCHLWTGAWTILITALASQTVRNKQNFSSVSQTLEMIQTAYYVGYGLVKVEKALKNAYPEKPCEDTVLFDSRIIYEGQMVNADYFLGVYSFT